MKFEHPDRYAVRYVRRFAWLPIMTTNYRTSVWLEHYWVQQTWCFTIYGDHGWNDLIIGLTEADVRR